MHVEDLCFMACASWQSVAGAGSVSVGFGDIGAFGICVAFPCALILPVCMPFSEGGFEFKGSIFCDLS